MEGNQMGKALAILLIALGFWLGSTAVASINANAGTLVCTQNQSANFAVRNNPKIIQVLECKNPKQTWCGTSAGCCAEDKRCCCNGSSAYCTDKKNACGPC